MVIGSQRRRGTSLWMTALMRMSGAGGFPLPERVHRMRPSERPEAITSQEEHEA